MKKIILLLLVLSMIVGLFAACGNGDDTTASTQGSTSGTQGSTSGTESTAGTEGTEPTDPSEPEDPWAEYQIITIAQALRMDLLDGQTTEERYYICGTVTEMLNSAYGEMTLTDETGSIYVYGTYSADGSLKYSEMTDKAFEGDQVLLHCTLKNYQGTIEINNARLIWYKAAEVEVDPSGYTQMTIAEAREAEKDAKVQVSGVVARITYAFGMVPNGVVLVDGTNSIYVYDRDLAGRVSIGNQITILASKTYWVLEDEATSADRFGYKGCNQLENAVLVENDKGSHDFDKTWITESTVKQIMDTPASTDITTTIFKVTALVNKVEGNGFVNYYINDLDGTTGSYCYSQCSGSDFAWLDAFDGKICTVYLMALNAKSNSSGCIWRFLPVAVYDESFDVSSVDVPAFVVEYFGLPQFQELYTGDPALELIPSVSSDLLNFAGATLTYSSDNTAVVYFENNVMHCKQNGTTTITITASYNGASYSREMVITVEGNADVSFITVNDAINTAVGEMVTVKGIVGPSLVNRTGFYLIDESGIIAITTTADNMGLLKIGQEVVLTGLRDKFHNGEGDHAGQSAITNCEIEANYYGDHAYCDSFFVTDKTLADFRNLDATVDYSTTVFVLKAIVKVVETDYYTSIQLVDGDGNSVSLYCSSAKQYNWLKAYAGQEVTLELAACNWNNKTFWAGCVLAVRLDDGSKILNTLNFDTAN